MKIWRGSDSAAVAPGAIDDELPCLPSSRGAARRHFLKSLGALGAGALLPGAAALLTRTDAQAADATLRRIDVHHHHLSPTNKKNLGPTRVTRISDPSLTT